MNDAQHGKNFATADHTGTATTVPKKAAIAAALARYEIMGDEGLKQPSGTIEL
jgi:hypothetical protein